MEYTETNEWVRREGNIATVGITHLAQKELGEIVYVELPKVGQKVNAGDEVCVLESTKAASDVYTPLSGEVIEINEAILKNPQQINNSAEDQGWLFRLRI